MKNPRFILSVVVLAVLTACTGKPFVPIVSSNPWADDYSPVYSMACYKDWGTYNVHDPSVCRVGDTYYMYSTDAIYREDRREAREKNVPLGFIQMRKSTDLVNWEFVGWVFPEIPAEAVEWVTSLNDGRGATNVWAPYMLDCGNGKYHLYYCVSAFGRPTSCIGLAEASSPEGPWIHKGTVVKTDTGSGMNAIDPTLIAVDGKRYMHYGSYFGGLFCMGIDPATGFPLVEGDKGFRVAGRANYRRDNIEAPEIIRNPHNGKYYFFSSYDPLTTTYNVRACRSDNPDGPFVDFHGKEMADTTDNFPLLTSPYRFDGHAGWQGTAHCGVFSDPDGNFYMVHQGRLASDPGMMVLHLRQMFFTPDGWPVVSPERYAGVGRRVFSQRDLEGEWEVIRLTEPSDEIRETADAILHSRGNLLDTGWNNSRNLTLARGGDWKFDRSTQLLSLSIDGDIVTDLVVHAGHDWERGYDTILFTGLDKDGRSVWGKRVK